MVGVGMEPPALPSAAGLAARLTAHGVRPRRISAKRSWLPGCGRLGVDGRDDEAVAPAAAPLMAQNGGAPPLLGQAKEEEAPLLLFHLRHKTTPFLSWGRITR
jgi:[histone H3]-lysine9 N-trimethyltransferase EHMT